MLHDNLKFTGYLAPVGFEADLARELELLHIKVIHQYERLFLTHTCFDNIVFAQEVWFDVEILKFESISNASAILKERGKFFCNYNISHHRRAELICQKLPMYRQKKYNFLEPISDKPFSIFGLIGENEMVFTPKTNSKLPFGEIHFNEDKINPPSRAYLKLWELFTLHGFKPTPGQRVVDMGSCPGGWTWVLQTMGCNVVSVDKAEIEERVMKLPNVEFIQDSAFGIRPAHLGAMDWFYSDIICYPSKLLEFVNRWRESGLCHNFACTIKFQAPTDFETLFKFKEIPNSKIIHLSCNKHEVTWIHQNLEAKV